MSSGPNQLATQLRELGDAELVTKLRESKEELFNLRFQAVTGQLDNNRRLQAVRREIARVYTVMRERELGIAPAPVAPKSSESKPNKKAAKTTETTKTTKSAKSEEPAEKEPATPADDAKEKSEVAA